MKESTLTHYQYTLHKYLLPVLGDLPVSELNESTLERLFLQILSPRTTATSRWEHPLRKNASGC